MLDDIISPNQGINRGPKPQDTKTSVDKKSEIKPTPSPAASVDRKVFQRKTNKDDILDQVVKVNK